MEFVCHDGIKLNICYINKTCSYIELNGIKYNVTKVYLFTEHEGKFSTEDYIIKFSKRSLYLYDNFHNILNMYKFSRFYERNEELSNVNTMSIKSGNGNSNLLLINKFELKQNCYIELYKNEIGEFLINNDQNEIEIVKENYKIGEDNLYITENGNKLQISTKRNSKWNGSPIGKVM